MPNLNSTSKSQNKLSGPIFDKKHFNKKKLIAIPALIVALAVILWVSLPKHSASDKLASNQNTATISTTISKGDSKAIATRRVISEYLASHSDIQLSAGQRLFIEEKLRRTLADTALKVGESIEFQTKTISELTAAAQALKASTLAKWEIYAKGVKF